MSLTQVTPDVISTNTISGLISQGFTSMNVATFGTQTIEFGSSNTLVFQANTSLERMRIAANGDIGIGTTTPNSRLTINKNSGSPATIAGSPYFNIVGANADSPRLQFDAYGTGALTLIVFRKANGTLASPSALNSGDQIGNISAWGYGATGYSTTNRGYISFFADEAWTDSAQGTRIVFATATAGAASPGVERMRITANGDVGIATTAPAQRLHIGLTGANNYIQFGTTNEGFVIGRENSTGEFTFDATQASPYNVFRWRQSGTERMRIAADGNVGIGTSSPTFAAGGGLNVANGTFATMRARGGSSTGTDFAQGSDGKGYVYVRDNADLIVGTNNTERMRIAFDGQVAIGSSSADPFSTVNTRMVGISSSGGGTTTALNITSGAGSRIQFGIGATRTAVIYSDSTNYTAISTETALPLVFVTNQTERMRIDSSGNVGIGTNSPSSYGSKLAILANQNSQLFAFLRNDSSGSSSASAIALNAYGNTWGMEIGSAAKNNNSLTWQLDYGGTNAERLRLTTDGTLILRGGSTSATGTGITFPASQAASSDANTLDDYEEGSWTPSYSPSGSAFSSIAYSADTTGRYIKIGKMVYVLFWIRITSISGGSGTVRLTGFPFTPENISNLNPGTVVHLASGWGTYTPFSIDYSTGTNFNLKYRASVSGALDPGDINVTDLAANCFMRGSFCYQTSA